MAGSPDLRRRSWCPRRRQRACSLRLRPGGWLSRSPSTAGGVTVHGTYTHPRTAPAGTLPAAVLLGGSGSATDRNDNSPGQPGPEHARGGGQLAVGRRGRQPALRQAGQRPDRMGQVCRASRAGRDRAIRARGRRRAELPGPAAADQPGPPGGVRAQPGRDLRAAARLRAGGSCAEGPRGRAAGAGPRSLPRPARAVNGRVAHACRPAGSDQRRPGAGPPAGARPGDRVAAPNGRTRPACPMGWRARSTATAPCSSSPRSTATIPPRSPRSSPRTQRCCSPAATPTAISDAPR